MRSKATTESITGREIEERHRKFMAVSGERFKAAAKGAEIAALGNLHKPEPPIRPLHDRVAVILDEFKEESKHIITPDVAKEKPYFGTVEAVGPGKWRDGENGPWRQPLMVKEGDRVLISPAVNLGYSDIMEKQGRVIIQEADILGVLS